MGNPWCGVLRCTHVATESIFVDSVALDAEFSIIALVFALTVSVSTATDHLITAAMPPHPAVIAATRIPNCASVTS